jgi:Contractile injection system tube protein
MSEQQIVRGFFATLQVFPPLALEFQFNPDSIRDNKEVRFEPEMRELGAPRQRYIGGGERTISFSFELHGFEQGADPDNPTGLENGIAPQLAVLRSFMYPRSDAFGDIQNLVREGRAAIAPPTCIFGFGSRLLECWMTSLSITETQFNRYLVPVRADVEVTLSVIEEEANGFYQLDRVRRNLAVTRKVVSDVTGLLGAR